VGLDHRAEGIEPDEVTVTAGFGEQCHSTPSKDTANLGEAVVSVRHLAEHQHDHRCIERRGTHRQRERVALDGNGGTAGTQASLG